MSHSKHVDGYSSVDVDSVAPNSVRVPGARKGVSNCVYSWGKKKVGRVMHIGKMACPEGPRRE